MKPYNPVACRSAGALLIGKTNMHEIGIGVTGLNLIHGTPRNPYAPGHYTGGSSSGSAAAVAAGLCPLAIAADGGGAIRIPSAFCGLVGLKPTFGRVSEFGAVPLCWSVAHIGPIGATATDAALGYAVMAGPDPRDPMSMSQPRPTLEGWDRADLKGLECGVYWPWFRHAAREITAECESLLEKFQELGARLRTIEIPDLEAARVAQAVTISAEMAQALEYASVLKADIGSDWKGKASVVAYAIAIPAAFLTPAIAGANYVLVAILWLVPDRRIERALANRVA